MTTKALMNMPLYRDDTSQSQNVGGLNFSFGKNAEVLYPASHYGRGLRRR